MEADQTEEFLKNSRFWIQRVFVPILVFIGVLGNIITVMVLTRKRMRCTTTIYLTALAVADILYLLFVLLLSFEHYPNINNIRYELYWRFSGINHWLCDAASSTSVWLTVSFTIERYIVVCHPIRGKILCTENRAKSIIAIIGILCLITTASTVFEYQLNTEGNCTPKNYQHILYHKDNYNNNNNNNNNNSDINNNNNSSNSNECIIRTEATSLGKNDTYLSIMSWFAAILFGLLPLILIATFNCFLINAVYKSQNERKLLTNLQDHVKLYQENRITLLLIGVVVLFLVCQTPTATFLIYDALDTVSSDRHIQNIKKICGNIFNLLLAINAACNFILYCVLSDRYRRTFKALFCQRNMNRNDTLYNITRSRITQRLASHRDFKNGIKRNTLTYNTPRNLEAHSLTSIPRSKSLMVRQLGKAKSTDINV